VDWKKPFKARDWHVLLEDQRGALGYVVLLRGPEALDKRICIADGPTEVWWAKVRYFCVYCV